LLRLRLLLTVAAEQGRAAAATVAAIGCAFHED